MKGRKPGKQAQTYTTIQRLTSEKMVTDVLDIPQQEFEKLVKQYSHGAHSEQNYIPFTLEEAQGLAKSGEELAAKGGIRTEGFEKAVAFFMTLTEQIWELTQEHKSFRMELFYNVETLKTNYCFFIPADNSAPAGAKPESAEKPDYEFSEGAFDFLQNPDPTLADKMRWAFEQDDQNGAVTIVPMDGEKVVIHNKQEAEWFCNILTECFQ